VRFIAGIGAPLTNVALPAALLMSPKPQLSTKTEAPPARRTLLDTLSMMLS